MHSNKMANMNVEQIPREDANVCTPQNQLAPPIDYEAMTDEELKMANANLKHDDILLGYYENEYNRMQRGTPNHQFDNLRNIVNKLQRKMVINRVNYLLLEEEVKSRVEKGSIALLIPNTTTMVLSKAKWDAPMEDVCGICMESHTMCDTLITSCNHSFGKVCYGKWAAIRTNSRLCVSCPMCNTKSPTVTVYRQHATKKNVA